MSFDLESAYLDVDAIDAGRWVPLGADFPGVEINACGLSSEAAQELFDRLRREAPREDRLANGLLSDAANERIIRKVILEVCLKDWRGFTSNGKPVPYAKNTAEGLLTDRKARLIANAIVGAIMVIDGTRITVDVGGVEKN